MEEEEKEVRCREMRMRQRLMARLERLSMDMEKYNIAEYIQALNDPRRFIFVNFMGGIARGLGIAIGATLLAAVVLFFLQRLVMLNLPLIGDFIAELIKIVNQQL